MEIQEKPGFVRIEISASRDLENITSEPESFQDSMQWEKHSSEKVLEMRCDSNDSKAQYRLSDDALVREKKDEPGVMQAVGRRVKIPPVHEAIDRYYRFTTRYEAVFPENYSDMVSFDRPTIGVVLEAECPPNFRITAFPADISTYNRWEYRRLFLPGEHIRFRWERNTEESH
jgi:hypothetical protein